MKILKLPHAGMIIADKETKIICDPLFPGHRIQSVYELDPGYRLSNGPNRELTFDAVILSHHHEDHFHLESLNRIHRSSPIYFPRNDKRMETILRQLGFKNLQPCRNGQIYKIGTVELIPTPSRVYFPEMGFIIRNKNCSIWNLVDSHPSLRDLKSLVARLGRPDIIFTYFQCLQEAKVQGFDFDGRFPIKAHQVNLDRVRAINPKYVVPSSSDLFNVEEPWLNFQMNPVSKERFVHDVEQSSQDIRGLIMSYGDMVEIRRKNVVPIKKFPLAIRVQKTTKWKMQWNPTAGKVPVRDHCVPTPSRKAVEQFFHSTFLESIKAKKKHRLTLKMIQDQVTWRVRVVFPNKRTQSFVLDFGNDHLRWRTNWSDEAVVDIETTVGAGDLIAFASGRLRPYALIAGGYSRLIDRYYRVENWKVRAGLREIRLPLEVFFLGHLNFALSY